MKDMEIPPMDLQLPPRVTDRAFARLAERQLTFSDNTPASCCKQNSASGKVMRESEFKAENHCCNCIAASWLSVHATVKEHAGATGSSDCRCKRGPIKAAKARLLCTSFSKAPLRATAWVR